MPWGIVSSPCQRNTREADWDLANIFPFATLILARSYRALLRLGHYSYNNIEHYRMRKQREPARKGRRTSWYPWPFSTGKLEEDRDADLRRIYRRASASCNRTLAFNSDDISNVTVASRTEFPNIGKLSLRHATRWLSGTIKSSFAFRERHLFVFIILYIQRTDRMNSSITESQQASIGNTTRAYARMSVSLCRRAVYLTGLSMTLLLVATGLSRASSRNVRHTCGRGFITWRYWRRRRGPQR
jgi:hypothetical protein